MSHREAFIKTKKFYGVTNKALYDQTGVSRSHISEFINCKRDMTTDVLDKLIKGMDKLAPGAKTHYCKLLLGKEFVNYEEIVDNADPAGVARILNAVSKRVGKGDLMQENKRDYHPLEETNMSFEDVKKLVDNLSDEDKRKLAQHLIGGNKSPLNVILGGYNVINNSVSLQLNGDVETVAEQLKNCDTQTIQLLLDAIALVINSPK